MKPPLEDAQQVLDELMFFLFRLIVLASMDQKGRSYPDCYLLFLFTTNDILFVVENIENQSFVVF